MKDDLPTSTGLRVYCALLWLKAGLENAALKDCSPMHVLEATILEKNYEVSLYSFRLARFRYLGLPGKS